MADSDDHRKVVEPGAAAMPPGGANGESGEAGEAAPPYPADPVAVLVAGGEYAAAAQISAAQGDLPRAIALYERIWRFADALPLALQLGDRPLAIRLALDAGDGAAAARIAEEIPRDRLIELRAAASSFAARGNHWEAARMAERAGEVTLAAGYFRRAGSLLDYGRMEELAGRPREAGMAYEQALAAAVNSEDAAAAHLALGRLLARLGRHQDAARALQQAMRDPTFQLPAGCALVAPLIALGFRIAAAEIVQRLRRQWPELPDSAEGIAALDAADVAASASSVGHVGVSATPGLLRHRFKVLRSLGAGATSHVYLAEDTLLGQPVALKLLSVGGDARGAERQAYLRFTREAEAAGRLRHPNIVALYDADPAMGLFVLELMTGGTLADRLAEQGMMSPVAVRRLALDLLSALGAAHEAGMVHRDVKPANILFDAVGNAKLSDFGAAHLVDFGQTQTGGLLGTIAYMSPEQISGGTIGPAADLYALAVTLFEALTGQLPFPGPDIVAQHLAEEPRRPSACIDNTVGVQARAGAGAGAGAGFIGGVTEAHDAVLLRALRKAPSERWRSAAHMADAVRSWPADHQKWLSMATATAQAQGPHLTATGATIETATNNARAEGVMHFGGLAPGAGTQGALPGGAALAASPDVLLGRSTTGVLICRDDASLGRPVLVEIRDDPPTGEALLALQTLAAAGGPYVQRVLALSDDARAVTYELCDGPLVSAAALSAEQVAALAQASAALDAPGLGEPERPRPIVMTAGGPVILIVTPTGEGGAGDDDAAARVDLDRGDGGRPRTTT